MESSNEIRQEPDGEDVMANVTYEDFSTLPAEIEAVLNSRRIVAMTPDPKDELALTPRHLLLGRRLKTLPEPEDRGSRAASVNQSRQYTLLRQQFWKMFCRDYLVDMKHRTSGSQRRSLSSTKTTHYQCCSSRAEWWKSAKTSAVKLPINNNLQV